MAHNHMISGSVILLAIGLVIIWILMMIWDSYGYEIRNQIYMKPKTKPKPKLKKGQTIIFQDKDNNPFE